MSSYSLHEIVNNAIRFPCFSEPGHYLVLLFDTRETAFIGTNEYMSTLYRIACKKEAERYMINQLWKLKNKTQTQYVKLVSHGKLLIVNRFKNRSDMKYAANDPSFDAFSNALKKENIEIDKTTLCVK